MLSYYCSIWIFHNSLWRWKCWFDVAAFCKERAGVWCQLQWPQWRWIWTMSELHQNRKHTYHFRSCHDSPDWWSPHCALSIWHNPTSTYFLHMRTMPRALHVAVLWTQSSVNLVLVLVLVPSSPTQRRHMAERNACEIEKDGLGSIILAPSLPSDGPEQGQFIHKAYTYVIMIDQHPKSIIVFCDTTTCT